MERYDLFRRLEDGAPLWVKTTADLNLAIREAVWIGRMTGTTCFVSDLSRNKTLFDTGKEEPRWAA